MDLESAGPTYPFGSHVSVVEVDTETGKVTLLRHVAVDDAGRILNPLLAEGQVHGGVAQGAAQALLEEMVYDDEGNPLTSTLADYAFITAAELPSFETGLHRDPDAAEPARGQGASASPGPSAPRRPCRTPSVDAVAHLGVRHIDMPDDADARVWGAISGVRQRGSTERTMTR